MIRPYQKSDKCAVLTLCEEFWNASCTNDYGAYDEEHTSKKLDSILESGTCFVCDDLSGFILLVESTNLCNPNPIAAEVAWYVTPASRKGNGIKLLNAAINYCKLKQIKTLSMMFMQSSMPDSIVKIYDRMGFELAETTYIARF